MAIDISLAASRHHATALYFTVPGERGPVVWQHVRVRSRLHEERRCPALRGLHVRHILGCGRRVELH